MSKHYQSGAAQAVAIVVLVVALLGALGWIFYQNMTKETAKVETTDSAAVETDKADTAVGSDVKEDVVLKYIDFRKNKEDVTGLKITSKADVSKLIGVSDELKTYFESIAGIQQQDPFDNGKMFTPTYTVDRAYGKYAAGSGPGHYRVWGPKDGSGEITEVAGTQNTGFSCDELKAAKVPSELVDGKCIAKDGSGLTSYTTP